MKCMALDVHLTREPSERWGFELIGGTDLEMPITMVKIQPNSPAKRAGLQNGDTVLTICGEEAIDMTLEAACRKVAECGDAMALGVMRGLYDPVLDDQEPIYDYEPEDLDPQSEPTEVSFKIQQFVDPSDLGSNLLEYGNSPPLTESRSLTASPFVTPTKPYRPFSTEPVVEVPPLEDPIILNPNYRDQFGKTPDLDPDYLLNALTNGVGLGTRYKLPISAQYDPDGTRFVQNVEVVDKLLKYEKHVKSLSKDLEVVDVTKETKLVESIVNEQDVKVDEKITEVREQKDEKKKVTIDVEEQAIKEELQYIEKMRQEIDIDKIEETALTLVDESIERAVSVAEEIKKEIDEELITSEVKEEAVLIEKKVKSESKKEESLKASKVEKQQEYLETSDETEIIQSEREERVAKEERRESQDERVRVEKSEQYESREEYSDNADIREASEVKRQSIIEEEYHQEELPRRKASSVHESYENKSEYRKMSKTETSGGSERQNAQQRVHAIGLQTIPNIKGIVPSPLHYDLLLRTFFVHLTDVMVALSRFMLHQPIFTDYPQQSATQTQMYESRESMRKSSQEYSESSRRSGQERVERQERVVKQVPVVKQEVKSQKIEKDMKVESLEKKVERKEIIKPVAVKAVKQEEKKEIKEEAKSEVVEKKAVTGAQMAQRSEKKLSQDMTQKMDAVISEFQSVAVEEDVKKQMMQRSRRSTSRSQIEEEVMKEGDPLEWLSKVDSRRASQERTQISKKEFSSTSTEKKSKVETVEEVKQKKPKTPKQTYVAIVESHVYTNKDAIFEEHVTDFSETSSVQSAEEVNTAIETIETMTTENVALESAIKELETAKVIDTHELSTAVVKSEATVQKLEEVVLDTKEIVQEEIKKETAVKSADVQEVIIQESKEIIEPIVEIKESKIEKVEKVAVDINESLSIAEATDISVLETKTEMKDLEIVEEKAAVVVEEEKIKEKAEVVEPKPIQVVEVAETVKIKPKKEKPVIDEFAALKIIKKIETEGNLSPEVIVIEDISDEAISSILSHVKTGELEVIKSDVQLSAAEELSVQKSGVKESVEASKSIAVTKQSEDISKESIDIAKSTNISKESVDISATKSVEVSKSAESSIKTEAVQESSFTAKSTDRKLSLRTDLRQSESQTSLQSAASTIDTPTPSTVPPTPLTDEYVFKLKLPLPKSRSATPVPRDSTPTPEDEDPHIVKKKLIPHIDTTIERVIYDPPLPTPVEDKPQSPVYTKPGLNGGGKFRLPVYRKPGLFGGADRPEYSKEEIKEIERKSSLLASAIDETIKSIEEYKEEVGIDTKKEVKTEQYKEEKISKSYQESYHKEMKVETSSNGFKEIDTKIEEMLQNCNALAIEEAKDTSKEAKTEREEKIIPVEVERESAEIKIKETIENDSKVKEKAVKFDSEVKEIPITPIDSFEVVPPAPVVKEEVKENVVLAEPTPIIEEPKEAPIIKEEEIRKVIPPVVTEAERREVLPHVVKEVGRTEVEKRVEKEEEKPDPLLGFRPVVFDPEAIPKRGTFIAVQSEPVGIQEPRQSPYMTETGELMGTIQGIVDGLEEPVLDEEVAKQLGKPGISEEKIAELISGEAEMLREAHVMGLSRVLNSHMHRADDSSVDFQKIKPMIDSLKDSEVLKALNEELARQKAEEKKKEEKRWTTFLQKPKRPVPKVKFGYHGWTEDDHVVAEPYTVKIVKQAKPKVAPDYKPEDFETGPLPWEERAVQDASLPPVEPEEPILIPEVPEFLEAVDPLKESEVPDLEDTGIPLPLPKEPTPPPIEEQPPEEVPQQEEEATEVQEVTEVQEEQPVPEDMDNRLAEQLVTSVQRMVDPNASVEQQLMQMRAQLAALAQLPEVIQQTLDLVSKQLVRMGQQETQPEVQNYHEPEVVENHQQEMQTIQEGNENETQEEKMTIQEVVEETPRQETPVPQVQVQEETATVTEEDLRLEKQRKIDNWNQIWPWGNSKSYCRQYRESNCHLVDFHRLRETMVNTYDKLIEDQLHEIRKASRVSRPPQTLGGVQTGPRHGPDAAKEG
ncbi:titin-like isoform X3 [Trichoplusia ni]|uniref:Titin-like isoform X3 n=1 Tax=Trichoplusia ni TaxID=7111 RepID=A0A7E5V890_TRINI|nr:titin-like isoform X3 [Trichoplusia ni]